MTDQTTAPLTAVGVEQLRDIRSRLNRAPKGSPGDKSVGPLSRGFFDICARVDLPVGEPTPVGIGSVQQVLEADMGGLRRLVSALHALKAADPKAYRGLYDGGVLQAVVTRRLVLAGRERSSEAP